MIYVFDTSSLIDLFNNFYESRFPSLWRNFDQLVASQQIVSVREAANEIKSHYKEDRLTEWIKQNPNVFTEPIEDEVVFVKEIFEQEHFQTLISRKSRLKGQPVADPFVIARARFLSATVITQERFKENAAKIPNVCEHFAIKWTNLEGFMEQEEWKF